MFVCTYVKWVKSLTVKVLKIDEHSQIKDAVEEASQIILDGGLVVFPTDTSYGLACNPISREAIDKLIDVKNRDRKLGLPLLFTDFNQCETYHEFNSLERVLTRLFWPGALTLVVKAKDSVPDHLTVGRNSLAIRVPNHDIPRALAKEIDGAIVGTSANKSGGPDPFTIEIAIDELGNEVDLYIDAGVSGATKSSTIVGVEEDGNIKVYREGQVSIEELTDTLKVDSDALKFWTTRIVYADM